MDGFTIGFFVLERKSIRSSINLAEIIDAGSGGSHNYGMSAHHRFDHKCVRDESNQKNGYDPKKDARLKH